MEEKDVPALHRENADGMWSKNIYILVGVVRIGRPAPYPPTTTPYFPSDHIHPVHATIPRDPEAKCRLERVELQRFRLMARQGRWNIDRTAGFQCGAEDCIFLSRIQEMKDEASDEDEGLRQWLLGQMKLY